MNLNIFFYKTYNKVLSFVIIRLSIQHKTIPNLGKAVHEVVYVGVLGALHHFFHRRHPAVVPVPDVSRYGGVEQYGLLGHDPHVAAQVAHLHRRQVLIGQHLKIFIVSRLVIIGCCCLIKRELNSV